MIFMTEMDQKSRVLVLGATGYIGKYIAKASAQLGHPTFVLVRPAIVEGPLNSSKKELLDSFTAAGITILHVCTPSIINKNCFCLDTHQV
jgi:nucleoside-diphosphate-sugar epimerase